MNASVVFVIFALVLVTCAFTCLPGWDEPKTRIGLNSAGRRYLTDAQFALLIAGAFAGVVLFIAIISSVNQRILP